MAPKRSTGQRLTGWRELGKLFRLESAGQGWEENFCVKWGERKSYVREALQKERQTPECPMESNSL